MCRLHFMNRYLFVAKSKKTEDGELVKVMGELESWKTQEEALFREKVCI